MLFFGLDFDCYRSYQKVAYMLGSTHTINITFNMILVAENQEDGN